jgi:hypothetical protein
MSSAARALRRSVTCSGAREYPRAFSFEVIDGVFLSVWVGGRTDAVDRTRGAKGRLANATSLFTYDASGSMIKERIASALFAVDDQLSLYTLFSRSIQLFQYFCWIYLSNRSDCVCNLGYRVMRSAPARNGKRKMPYSIQLPARQAWYPVCTMMFPFRCSTGDSRCERNRCGITVRGSHRRRNGLDLRPF